jgi:hypothetical protein
LDQPHTRHTGGLPLTSPKTNEQIEAAQALLFPNTTLRTLIVEYREAKTREWREAEQRWQQWAAAAGAAAGAAAVAAAAQGQAGGQQQGGGQA